MKIVDNFYYIQFIFAVIGLTYLFCLIGDNAGINLVLSFIVNFGLIYFIDQLEIKKNE